MQIELKNKKETKTLKIDENTTVEDEILNDSDVMEVIKVIYGG